MKDGLKLIGDVVIERRKKDGTVIDREEIKNLIVNSGKERVAKLIAEGVGTGLTGFSYLALGTGTTAPVATNTSLETEVTRELATVGYATVGYEASYKATFEKTFDFGTGESYSITEAGVGDSASATGDTLLDRFVFSAKSVDVDTDLYVKVTITVS